MAPIKKTTPPTTNRQPPTAAPHGPSAPTNAPAQVSAVTAEGVQKKTGPTFAGNPALKPAPPSKQVKIVQADRPPAPRGPAGANEVYTGQARLPANPSNLN